MAAPKGRQSPVIGVRVPPDVHRVIHAAAKLQGVTVTDLVRDCIVRCFDGLIDDLTVARELEARKAQLGRDVEGQP